MGTSAFPLSDDIVILGDQVRRTSEIEVRERRAEIGHERPDIVAATTWLVQRVFEQHIRRRNLVDDREIDLLAPELGEPAADNGLVIVFLAHWIILIVGIIETKTMI